ncbi:hypothetical protein WJX73_009063 [Symbiochloris irregularis]|uniref:Uncharacterized protein n=1 Tax=Symbiochloris irregularis TaxID=706552 RepID=A0AAW1NN15_9CHLO
MTKGRARQPPLQALLELSVEADQSGNVMCLALKELKATDAGVQGSRKASVEGGVNLGSASANSARVTQHLEGTFPDTYLSHLQEEVVDSRGLAMCVGVMLNRADALTLAAEHEPSMLCWDMEPTVCQLRPGGEVATNLEVHFTSAPMPEGLLKGATVDVPVRVECALECTLRRQPMGRRHFWFPKKAASTIEDYNTCKAVMAFSL